MKKKTIKALKSCKRQTLTGKQLNAIKGGKDGDPVKYGEVINPPPG